MQTGLISPSRERQEGLSLELNGVGRRDAGVYICTATNGVGKPARAEITVEVKCECISTASYSDKGAVMVCLNHS